MLFFRILNINLIFSHDWETAKARKLREQLTNCQDVFASRFVRQMFVFIFGFSCCLWMNAFRTFAVGQQSVRTVGAASGTISCFHTVQCHLVPNSRGQTRGTVKLTLLISCHRFLFCLCGFSLLMSCLLLCLHLERKWKLEAHCWRWLADDLRSLSYIQSWGVVTVVRSAWSQWTVTTWEPDD